MVLVGLVLVDISCGGLMCWCELWMVNEKRTFLCLPRVNVNNHSLVIKGLQVKVFLEFVVEDLQLRQGHCCVKVSVCSLLVFLLLFGNSYSTLL